MSDKTLQPGTPARPTLVEGQETIGLTALEEFASRIVAAAFSDPTTRANCAMDDAYAERVILDCVKHAQKLVRILAQTENGT